MMTDKVVSLPAFLLNTTAATHQTVVEVENERLDAGRIHPHLSPVLRSMGVPRPALPAPKDRCATAVATAAAPPVSPALPAPFSLLHPHWLLPYTCSQVGSPPNNGAMDGGGWSRGYGRRVWLSMHAARELAASPAIQVEIGGLHLY